MEKLKSLFLAALLLLSGVFAYAQPALVKKNGSTHFEIDGRPYLILSGELHNSTSTSEAYMRRIGVWEQMKEAHFNTVIASCSWDVVEKQEGQYDFSSVDHVITGARENGLKVVLIWFASWKNGISTYVPGYIKRDPGKYPLVQTRDGKYLNVLSTFSENAMNADKKAFSALMGHIRDVDYDHTVIMMQVENEIGILGSVRDFSSPAQKAFNGPVPSDLITYLQKNKGKLYPELDKVWAENGSKTRGTWEEVFGKGRTDTEDYLEFPYYTEEIFQAYHYARYVNEIVSAGKAVYDLPMYVNNWLRQPGMGVPGTFPSGSPLPEVLDIWRAAAPEVDFSAPDIYISQFDWVLKEFSRSGNPIFIPECRGDVAKALYAFGEYDALGFAPFGFDGPQNGGYGVSAEEMEQLGQCYGILSGMDQMIMANYGSDRMRGLLVTDENPSPSIEMGDYVLTATSSVRNRTSINYGQGAENLAAENAALASRNLQSAPSGALVIQSGPEEFFIVGINVNFRFTLRDQKTTKGFNSVGTDLIEEGTFQNGKWVPERNLNGDENRVSIIGVGAEHIRLYKSMVHP